MEVPGKDLPFPMPFWERLVLLLLVTVLVYVLSLLASLEPDPRGMGTHEQLGMAPCSWPIQYDMPCPTCGVTTSAVALLHLDPLTAFRIQPFGALFTLAGIWFGLLALRHVVRGRSLFARMAFWPWSWILVTATVVLLGSWSWKIAVFRAG